MAHNLLKVAPPDTTFAKIWVKCISIFGTRLKKAAKTTVSTNIVKSYAGKGDQPVRLANQICRNKKKDKIKAQTEVIEWQKKEIEYLKATTMHMDLQKMIEAMTQAMAFMYNTQKDPSKKMASLKLIGYKPYLGQSKQPEITKGLNGTTDPDLMCQYYKDSGYQLENHCKFQWKIQWEQLAAESVIVGKVLNMKHSWKWVQYGLLSPRTLYTQLRQGWEE